MQINSIFKEFENISVEKKTLSIAAIEGPGLESQLSRKRLFTTERFSNSLNIYIFHFQPPPNDHQKIKKIKIIIFNSCNANFKDISKSY